MDLLACEEEMMPETPEGTVPVPGNMSEILQRRELSAQLKFDGERVGTTRDPDLLNGGKVLEEMLRMEEVLQAQISPNIFTYTQTSVTAGMRTELLYWLYEVCDAERYPEWVFLRTCSYIDRIMSAYTLVPNQLQLLGVVCLSISLKFHGVQYTIGKLLYYTDNSVPKDLIFEWELMVLYGLKWDMGTIIPTDFVQIFEEILPKTWFSEKIMNQVSTFLSYCATDSSFILHTPSTIAVASLTVAINHLISKETGEEALEKFSQITHIDKDLLRTVMDKIHLCLTRSVTSSSTEENSKVPGCGNPGLNNNSLNNNNNNLILPSKQVLLPEPMAVDKVEEIAKAETPTDVGDIHF